jgi:hypothetical protein
LCPALPAPKERILKKSEVKVLSFGEKLGEAGGTNSFIINIMPGEKDLKALLKTMRPKLNEGDYVFCTTTTLEGIDPKEIIGLFVEDEGWTVIVNKGLADKLGLSYSYIAAWVTLTIHSSLEAVGLTAAFATALGKEGISCNVVAAYYHDHIFVAKQDAEKTIETLTNLSKGIM